MRVIALNANGMRAAERNGFLNGLSCALIDLLFGELGFVDFFCRINPNPDQYTSWSNLTLTVHRYRD